jgi:O-antigen ligase
MQINVLKKISNIKKIEKVIEYLAYLLIIMFYTGKLFEVFTFLIDILFLILLNVKKDKSFFTQYKVLLIAFSLLFTYLFFQSFVATDIPHALKNSLGMFRFVILFFALIYIFNTPEKIIKLVFSIFIIIGLLFIDASVQFFTGTDLFGYPLYANIRLTCWSDMPQLSPSIPIFLGVILTSWFTIKNKKIVILIIVFFSLMLLLAGNRGSVVYAIGSLLVVLMLSSYRKFLFQVLLGLALALVIVFSLNQQLYKQFSVYKDPFNATNNSGRTPLYEVAIDMIKDKPLLGIGSKNFRYDFSKYYLPVYNRTVDRSLSYETYRERVPYHVHNMLLSFLLNWGIVGTSIFLYILYYIYKHYMKGNDIAILSSVGLLYTVAPYNFGQSIAQGYWQFYIFLTLSFVVIMSKYKSLDK